MRSALAPTLRSRVLRRLSGRGTVIDGACRARAVGVLAVLLAWVANPATVAAAGAGVVADASGAAVVGAGAGAVVARPRLGLVLGGGGARGMAHIGVLKVLEELRIPVDVITGTSMGSIVGGVFATGMTATEMERRVLAVDWNEVFDDRIDRANLSMRRKEDSRAPLFRPEFGLRDGKIQLPVGAITGRRLDLLLHDLTLPATRQASFDDLPIPFRAVATDLVTGDMVVQRAGFLSQVVRASMSVPGAFDPVEIDGRLLVDGGLVRNVPVDIARDMGAEVVIAVDVGALNRGRSELDSLTAVLDQMVNINIRRNADASLASLSGRDVKIIPDLGTVGSADFPRAAEAIAAGEKAARAVADQLATFSTSPEAYASWQRSLARPAQDAERYDFVEIVGPQRVNPKALLSTMTTRPGDTVTAQQINDDLERLQARGEFEQVEARTIEDDRGQGLRMKFTEKRWGPNIMKLGLSLNSDAQGDSAYELGARYTRAWINELGGELRAEASYGRLRRAYGELYQPLDLDGLIYVRPYAGAQRNTVNLFQGHQRVAVYDVQDAFTGFDLGHQLFKWADLSVGARYSASRALPIIGLPNYPTVQTHYGG
jgi:NTE family protein